MRRATMAFAAAALALAATGARSQALPFLVHYEGVLARADGSPVATGDHIVRFRVFDAESGGNLLWGPQAFDLGPDDPVAAGHARKVRVAGGRFSVVLGPEDVQGRSLVVAFWAPAAWIEVELETGPIAPRERVLSAPYAFHAHSARSWSGMQVQFAEGVVGAASVPYRVTFDPPFASPPVVSVQPQVCRCWDCDSDRTSVIDSCSAVTVTAEEMTVQCRYASGKAAGGARVMGTRFNAVAVGPSR